MNNHLYSTPSNLMIAFLCLLLLFIFSWLGRKTEVLGENRNIMPSEFVQKNGGGHWWYWCSLIERRYIPIPFITHNLWWISDRVCHCQIGQRISCVFFMNVKEFGKSTWNEEILSHAYTLGSETRKQRTFCSIY